MELENAQLKFGAINGRINDLESKLADIQSWRDPRGIQGKLDTLFNEIENLVRDINSVRQDVESIKLTVSPMIIEQTIPTKHKRGRPNKDVA